MMTIFFPPIFASHLWPDFARDIASSFRSKSIDSKETTDDIAEGPDTHSPPDLALYRSPRSGSPVSSRTGSPCEPTAQRRPRIYA